MSQFDFPRINFFGEAIINPPTANNNVLLPLVVFDPIKIKTVMPPRIYLSKTLKNQYLTGTLPVPENTPLLVEAKDLAYIEIASVNTVPIFKEWIIKRLGESMYDEPYHKLYAVVITERDKLPLRGLIPANWNYYGGMEFEFKEVKVHSVEISRDNGNSTLYNTQSENLPEDIGQCLQASVDLNFDNGKNSAVMVDVTPTLALYTQVFCDQVRMTKDNIPLLRGRPSKASLRFLNNNRIINLDNVTGASGTFFCAISLSDIKGEEEACIIQLFNKYGLKKEHLKGVFIRYNLFEVQENQYPEYKKSEQLYNPARCSVLGSFTPWYGNELRSITMGRQMIPEASFFANKSLAPFVCNIDAPQQIIRLDMIGSIPEIADKTKNNCIYETYDIGKIQVKLSLPGGLEKDLVSIDIDQRHLDRATFIQFGGILDIPFNTGAHISKEEVDIGKLLLYGISKTGMEDKGEFLLLMSESEYMIATDEAGIYLDQYADPTEGYVSYQNKFPCKVHVYHRGLPYEKFLQMTIKELRIRSSASAAVIITFLETTTFKTQQELYFPTDEAAIVIYVLYPDNLYKGDNFLIPYMLRTGFFISLRVLPSHDYGRYLNPDHPDYPAKISFDFLYQEVLSVFDLIYPASSIITPFTEAYFKKAWKFIKQRLSPQSWHSAHYMPSSRDMSADQWQLLCKWAEDID